MTTQLYYGGTSCWSGNAPVGSCSADVGALAVCNTVRLIRDGSQHQNEQAVEQRNQQETSEQSVITPAVNDTPVLVPLCRQKQQAVSLNCISNV